MLTTASQYLRVIIALAGLAGLVLVFFGLTRFTAAKVGWFRHKQGVPAILSLTIGITLSILTLLGISSIYVYHGFGHQPNIYRYGDRELPMVAITFDDGPSPDFTPQVLDILRESATPATFFMVGGHVEKYPDIAARVKDEGHELGNHTYTHRNIPTLSPLDLHNEMVRATTAITDATGQYPGYVRPPRGIYDGRFRRLAALMGQQVVLWSVSSRDWRYGTTPQSIVKNVMSRAKNGDIILFHDSGALVRNEGGDRSATVKALPEIIEQLRQRGLQIVPLHVLLMNEEAPEKYPSVDQEE